jgi:hypothetical protein
MGLTTNRGSWVIAFLGGRSLRDADVKRMLALIADVDAKFLTSLPLSVEDLNGASRPRRCLPTMGAGGPR